MRQAIVSRQRDDFLTMLRPRGGYEVAAVVCAWLSAETDA
jgi:hypothetical protein